MILDIVHEHDHHRYKTTYFHHYDLHPAESITPRLVSLLLDFPTTHNTQLQKPNRRSIGFKYMSLKIEGTEKASEYNEDHLIIPGNAPNAYKTLAKYVRLVVERFRNTVIGWCP